MTPPDDDDGRPAIIAGEEDDDDDTDTDTDADDTDADEESNGGIDTKTVADSVPDVPQSADLVLSNPVPNPSTTTPPNPSTADPSAPPNGGGIAALPLSAAAPSAGAGERRSLPLDESRRLFQRLWTDDEEIIILRGFLEFTTRRGTTFASHQYDTGPFYEEIKRQLQLDFSKNQLIEKLRRLKKKYRNCVNRIRSKGKNFSFRSPHEQQIFEIARHIWRPATKHGRSGGDISGDDDGDDVAPPLPPAAGHDAAPDPGKRSSRSRRRVRRRVIEDGSGASPAPPAISEAVTITTVAPVAVPVTVAIESNPPVVPPLILPPAASSSSPVALVEETVRSCLSPLFKELIGSAIGAGPVGLFGTGPVLTCPPAMGGDERWRKQQIMELEVYLKRIELVKEQVLATLKELKSSSPKC